MKKKLAIIGADAGQIPLVNKAKEMGIETHCFSWDKEGFTDCKGIADYFHPISTLEKERILEECKKIKINGVASIMNDPAVPTVAFVAQGMGLIGNRYEDMLLSSNKLTMRQAFKQNHVKSPRFTIAKESMDLTGFQYPLIVKPTDRTGSIGVRKVERKEELQDTLQKSLDDSRRKEVIIEELISGVEVSIDSISWNGKHYMLAIKDKEISKTVDFLLLAKHYPAQLNTEIQDKLKSETIKALDAINFKYGAAVTQFKITEAGEIFSIEINPRMAGDHAHTVMKLHNGYDYVRGVIDVALGQFEEPVFTDNKYSGIFYLYEGTEWVRKFIENKECDPNIIETKFFEKEDIHGAKGYFIYQTEQKRRWES